MKHTLHNQANRASSETIVPTSQLSAFRYFVEDIAEWWVSGPINFFHSERSPHMHIDAKLGGLVREVYPDGDLVIAKISRFDPGVRLDLAGVIDDSVTEIYFGAHPEGTTVRVEAYLRPGGREAFLFWPNVVDWLSIYAATKRQP